MFLTLFSFLLTGQISWAAACCGGGIATPAVLTGEDRYQISAAFSRSQILEDVDSFGLWTKRMAEETASIVRVDSALVFFDRYQAGLSLPIVEKQKGNNSSSGLGDVALSAGYEFLRDWDYHPYRPKGIAFMQLVLPTGKSISESEELGAIDSRGRGFWAIGAGSIFTKQFGFWDAVASLQIHNSFKKSISTQTFQGELIPGWGSEVSLGGGYLWEKVRFGATMDFISEDPIRADGTIDSEGSAQRYSTASLMLSYLKDSEWSGTVSYANQTWIGDPNNTTLNESWMFLIRKGWPR